jgi:hypothetical protein
MEYTVIEGYHNDSVGFVSKINSMIKMGWIPQGGVSVITYQNNKMIYCQAMIKQK